MFRKTFESKNRDELSDQAAMNVLIYTDDETKNITELTPESSGDVVQCNRSMYSREKFDIISEQPIVDDEFKIINPITNIPFTIVHQYDRMEKINNFITKKYAIV